MRTLTDPIVIPPDDTMLNPVQDNAPGAMQDPMQDPIQENAPGNTLNNILDTHQNRMQMEQKIPGLVSIYDEQTPYYIQQKYSKESLMQDNRNDHMKEAKLQSFRQTVKAIMPAAYETIDYIRSQPIEDMRKTKLHHGRARSYKSPDSPDVLKIDIAGSGYNEFRADHKDFFGLGAIGISGERYDVNEKIEDKLKKETNVRWYHKKLSGFLKFIRTPEQVTADNERIRNQNQAIVKQFRDRKAAYMKRYGESVTMNNKKYDKVKKVKGNTGTRYTMAGPGALNVGDYSIENLREHVLFVSSEYLTGVFSKWKSKEDFKDVHIILKGHSRGAVGAVEGAMRIKAWVHDKYPTYEKYVKFDLTQYDPVPGFLSDRGLNAKVDLAGNNEITEDGKKMRELGGSVESTVIYSLHANESFAYRNFFDPQAVMGAGRIIITPFNHSAGLDTVDFSKTGKNGERTDNALRKGYTDAQTGDVFTGSSINAMAEGVYVMDEQNALVRFENIEQVSSFITTATKDADKQKARYKTILRMAENWFNANKENLNRQAQAKQQKDGWMTVSLKETELNMQQDYDKNEVKDSKSLEKAADVRFQNSINSRKGTCESKTAHKKRLAAGKKLKNRAGLTEHSVALSDGLQGYAQSKDERLANRQAEGEKYYDNWANNTMEGDHAVLHKEDCRVGSSQDRKRVVTAEEQRKLQAPEMKVLCFLPNDEARMQLLSASPYARCIAYEKLVNRAMDFDLQPNALCTLAAMQNAVKVQEHSEIVDAVREYINAEKFAEKQIPPYMMEQFNKFEQVFNALRSGTEATVKLQGINLDGSNVYDFDKNMTASEKKTLEATRKATQKDKSRAMSGYEKSLATYNKEFTGKRLKAKQEEEAAYFTKGKLNHKDYQRMRALEAVQVKGEVSMYVGTYIDDKWSKTDYGKQAGKERIAVEKKIDQGIALTDKEKETIPGVLRTQLASLLPYIERSDEDSLFGNDAKLRAVAVEKVLDKMLAMPITINKDINYYFNEASPEETAAITDLNGDASAMRRVLQDDKIAVQNIPAEKREKFSALYNAVSELYKILDAEAPLRGYTMQGKQYECTEAEKQELADKKALHMEPYQNAANVYIEQYDDSDELSQQRIAYTKSELGTDLGITKHTLDMADALKRQQPKAKLGAKRTQAKKEDFLPDYSTARTKTNKMVNLLDSVMEFKLDIKSSSAAPDMKNIPEIIAHSKKVEEAKQHIKEAQELKVAIPEGSMAQWLSYSAAFEALHSAAEAMIGMQGLTVEGESRYAQSPEITAEDVKAERYQLSNERELAGEKAKQLITDYNKQHIEATYEGSLEIAKAAKLLGTTIGVTAETYGLAKTLRANVALSKSNAEEGKKLRESDALKPMMAKQAALAAKKEAFENEYKELNKLHYAAIDSGDVKMIDQYNNEKQKHGKYYEYTEAEQQTLPRELNKYSDELLHLVQGDDKVKLFSESPEERASVYVKIIDIFLSKEIPENLYTDPALVQKMPEMAQLHKEIMALDSLRRSDDAADKLMPSGLVMRLSDLMSTVDPTTSYQKAMMQEHGIDEKGESLHTGAEAEKENHFMFENARQNAITEDKDNEFSKADEKKPRKYKKKQAAAKAKWHEQGGGDNEFTERFDAEQKKRAKSAQNAK